jgi:hypothetical protein
MKRIIVVLGDGTWATVGNAEILEVTEAAFAALCDGEIDGKDLRGEDVVNDEYRIVEAH